MSLEMGEEEDWQETERAVERENKEGEETGQNSVWQGGGGPLFGDGVEDVTGDVG